MNELYAAVFLLCHKFHSTGLRYFNVFGPRQDPNGAYAAVIPKWISAIANNSDVEINGDGKTSRDFCYIDNVVQANILAGVSENTVAMSSVFNVAVGEKTSLLELFHLIVNEFYRQGVEYDKEPKFQKFRQGDVLHSLADIVKISDHLGYSPSFDIKKGLEHSVSWYHNKIKKSV